jgi:hypothetical protein
MKRLVWIMSILGMLIISASLDIAYYQLWKIDSGTVRSSGPSLSGLQYVSGVNLTAVLLLALSWFLLRQVSPDNFVSIVCILLGAAILIMLMPSGAQLSGQLIPSENMMLRSWLISLVSSPLLATCYVAAFLICLGFIRGISQRWGGHKVEN